MEALGAFSHSEWDSFTAIFSSQDLQTGHDQSSFPNGIDAINGGSEVHKNSWFYSLDAFDPNLQAMSCSSCSTDSSSSVLFANPSNLENHCYSSDDRPIEHDYMFMPIDEKINFGSFFTDVLMEEKAVCGNGNGTAIDSAIAGKELPLKRRLHVPESVEDGGIHGGADNTEFTDNQKKKTRVSGEVEKNKKTQQWKKTQKLGSKVEEDGNAAASDLQSSISDCSEDDNASQDGGGSAAAVRKTRASRGSATDPQSLYARKRRERINERLRILQKLVPNGTKVDISTMLEEAVHYVKFLQLQIKLLSSDELWMYAPLAYNGMDIGLHHKQLSSFASH